MAGEGASGVQSDVKVLWSLADYGGSAVHAQVTGLATTTMKTMVTSLASSLVRSLNALVLLTASTLHIVEWGYCITAN